MTRVLDAIDRLGVGDDTLVIFLSDNGGALYTHAADNRPLQGGKFTLFEGGVRTEYAHAVRHGRWKLVRDTWHGTSALFDLEADPGEKTDLSLARGARVQELSAAWEQWNAGNRAPLWPHVMEFRFKANDGREYWYPL